MIKSRHHQSGFALLIFILVLIGLGGVVATEFSKQSLQAVEQARFVKNKKVLEEAKQTLLMYAYNHPDFNTRGPGRLPCPDITNNGKIGSSPTIAQCESVGRLPFNDLDLDFYEALDASGERLWYAVSEEYRNNHARDGVTNTNGDSVVNSDSKGTISIFDQTGVLIYDGATSGVAAVIIAPGRLLRRDENDDGVYEYVQVRGTNDEKNDPSNYLDTIGAYDNSNYTNGLNGEGGGFRLGPVIDLNNNELVINDLFVVITTDELNTMAEKATLEAYRDAIQAYLVNVGANNYPWLFNYDHDDLNEFLGTVTTTSAFIDGGALTNIGRIPSTFSNYFTDGLSLIFESELRLEVTKQFDLGGTTRTITANLDSALLKGMYFDEADPVAPYQGLLKANAGVDIVEQLQFYSETVSGSGIWTVCDNGAQDLTDCNRDSSGAFISGPNDFNTQVLRVEVELEVTNPIDIAIDYIGFDPDVDIEHTAASAAPEMHAEIEATFSADKVTNIGGGFNWEVGNYNMLLYTTIDSGSAVLDDNRDISFLTIPFLTNLSTSTVKIGVRYYPQFPSWAASGKNNWHKSIMMAIADDYMPSKNKDCVANPPCLEVSDIGGTTDDKVALLVIAGAVDAFTDIALDGFSDDLSTVFDIENDDSNTIFLRRQGDDTVMVLQ